MAGTIARGPLTASYAGFVLGMLLMLRERVRGDALRVQLRGVHGQPRDVLVMARFDRLFKLD